MLKYTVARSTWGKALVIVASMIGMAGCQIESDPKNELDKVIERGTLRVGTLNNQLSYYIGPDGPTGLDFELAKKFANELDVKLEMKPAYRIAELFPALERGEIDMIAAGLSQTPDRLKSFRAGPSYYYVSQQVVYKKGSWRPRNIEQLIEKQMPIEVVDGSHFERTMNLMAKQHPELLFTVDDNADVNELLQQVNQGQIPFTLADSVELSLAQRIYPSLAVAFEVTEDQPTSWFMRRSDDESLYALLIEYFGGLKQSGELAKLEEKYFGHIESFDFVDTRAFIRALESKLPKWEALFKQHAEEFDWRLIAALAYQESHWNPVAKSPTGVRGMMMLTLPTAKSVGVTDRLNPEQSVRGGVEYLRRIVKRIPDSIADHEKIWFALASYNVGYGHMMDARRLTKRQGGDPDSWADVKDRLPLLKKKKYYSTTRYGYARGDEARNYVENIRRYYQSIIGHIDKKRIIDQQLDTDDLLVIDVPISSAVSNAESTISAAENTTISSAKAVSE
ncbi:membrane-bound lytic murein transglycosylase MltF [Vibrio sp. SCSIO 43136]|uniref:membrane-bound lytic murein transglycosylase MltF n=1 Tax=Vibrio sp. SCSIO 43136 TaxID=2819101 RepID=UPI0020760F18|nr:membrane-bound lytic murein transglycosylase MltF [Vibrio sp. SCSIO 43136]USD66618.1 membrane-bound lytic murein transglycosylase MltF [Vibrio sp. SCSIO 43136]